MMALRDPFGKGRLVWGVFVHVGCATEVGFRGRALSYGMDPRSYAIVGIFADTTTVFRAIPIGPNGLPR